MTSRMCGTVFLLVAAMVGTAAAQPVHAPVEGEIPLGGVFGRVVDAAGPVAGARVTLYTPDLERFFERRTGPAGGYLITGVGPGVYRLGVAAVGYDYEEIEVVYTGGLIRRNFLLAPQSDPGVWEVIGNTLPEDHVDIGYLLPDGRIFYCHNSVEPVIFDPATGRTVRAPSSGSRQSCVHGTLLEDGRLIYIGGNEGGNFRNAVPWVKTFDPIVRHWQRRPDMQLADGRYYPGLARLSDWSLIVMGGGMRPDARRTETCEILDPATLTWRYVGSMLNPSDYTPAALLYTGEVLATWWPAQLYDPATEQWRATGSFVQSPRWWPGHSDHSIVVLADGRVVAIGIGQQEPGAKMAEAYDPATEQWSVVEENPGLLRYLTEVAALPDGRILVAGGRTQDPDPPVEHERGHVKWTDLFDPMTETWRRVADMPDFRDSHGISILLPDGRVSVTGGTQVRSHSADIEAYSPPYLRRGVRPAIEQISATTLRRGERVEMDIFPATGLTSVVLIGTGVHTHWVEGGVPRRLVLSVSQNGTQAEAILPTDPNVLPVGWYLLFAMVDDIPSEARIVKVER